MAQDTRPRSVLLGWVKITAELFAFVKFSLGFFTIDKRFEITEPYTLVEFDVDFFRPPTLATELDNGDLLLNVGEFANQRLFGVAEDIAEHIIVEAKEKDAEYVYVDVRAGNSTMDKDALEPQSYKVKRGRKIIAAGGEGDYPSLSK